LDESKGLSEADNASQRPADTAPHAASGVAPEATHKLLHRLLRERVRPYARRLVLAGALMIVVAATTAANAWLLQPAIDKIFVEQVPMMLWLVPLAIIVVAVIRGTATYGQSMLMHGAGQRIIADTQIALYEHLMRADLTYLNRVHTGTLLSNFLYDTQLLRDAVSRAITGIVKDGLTAVALTVVMFVQDWRLACVVVFVFPLTGVLVRKIGKRMRKTSTASQEETGRLSAHLSETLDGVRLVKAYGMEAYEIGRARERVEERLRQMMRMIRTRSAAVPFTEALGGLAVAVAILYGGWRAQTGDLSLGAFMSFLAALLMAYQPVKSLASLNAALQEGLAAAQRIFAMLDIEPEIRDRPDAVALQVTEGTIELDGVGFHYGDVAALENIDLTVPTGSTVALVGASGAGKTTLMNLIPRFYDATEGTIRVDGQDVRTVTLDSLRASVALVSQDTVLFDDSVRANIAYGRPGASEAEIVAAAEAAAAHGFISKLPQGYDTAVGENGVRLSGGQRQRIAIARAMLKDAPILLLDEATSALDTVAERKVQAALAALMRGRTTLVIAHRLSTVASADEICVLDAGRIVERGTHRQLMAQNGIYARLYGLQFADSMTDDGKVAHVGG
jgi:subfamily B ATP-binding cassette protein MsbA